MRHRFHSICPYFAMFPETFVAKHLAATTFAGVVFDPFCGRGTTVFESLVRNRAAAGCDIHPVAACISGAKSDPPEMPEVSARLDALEEMFDAGEASSSQPRDDGRYYTAERYWAFLQEAWQGVGPLLSEKARIVVRIGGRKLGKTEIAKRLTGTLREGTGRHICLVDGGVTSPVKRTQANVFRGPKASPTDEHDFCFIVG